MQIFNKVISNKYYASLLVILIIHIFSSPTYYSISPKYKNCPDCCSLQGKLDRKDHLLETVSTKYDPPSHMAKTEFRLTVPFLAKIFHIETTAGVYILQVLAGLLFFIFLHSLIYSIIPDNLIAFLFILSFGFLYPGFSFVAEMEGFFDSFAFFFLLVAMLDVHFLVVGVALFFAYWTDERAIFASSLILFYWQYKSVQENGRSFYTPTVKAYTLVTTLILYFALRWLLVNHFGFVNQLQGTGTIYYTINYMGIAFWQAFEGFWILIILSLYYLYTNKTYVIGAFFVILSIMIFLIGMNVMDLTRSVAYVFPAIIIALYIVKNSLETAKIRHYLMICLLFCFVYPSYNFIVGKPPHHFSPIYMRVAKKLLHIP